MEINRLLLEAIALRTCVRAVYNHVAVLLAPHILYERHGQLYVDAVTVARDGKPAREPKLGAFKISGLHGVELARQNFVPSPRFDPLAGNYAGVTLFTV